MPGRQRRIKEKPDGRSGCKWRSGFGSDERHAQMKINIWVWLVVKRWCMQVCKSCKFLHKLSSDMTGTRWLFSAVRTAGNRWHFGCSEDRVVHYSHTKKTPRIKLQRFWTPVKMPFIHNNIGLNKRGLGLLFYQNQAYLYFPKITVMFFWVLAMFGLTWLHNRFFRAVDWAFFDILPWWKIYPWLEVWRSRAWEHYKHHAISRHCGGISILWIGVGEMKNATTKANAW